MDLRIDCSGSRLAACRNRGADQGMFVWDLHTAQLLFTFGESLLKPINCLEGPLFSRSGDRVAVKTNVCHDIGTLWILDSTTGGVMYSIDDDRDQRMHWYLFVDDDKYIITSGHTSEDSPSIVRCWCASTGRRIASHWVESYHATVISSNAAAERILFGCVLDHDIASFDCFTAQGVHCRSVDFILKSDFGFADENTIVGVRSGYDGALPVLDLLDVVTGTVSEWPAFTERSYTTLYSIVANDASKILIAHVSRLYIVSTCQGETGEVISVIKDSLQEGNGRITSVYGVELDSVILL
jgi:hypothetical protein